MIRSIRFQNFRALESYHVSLRRLNVLVGPNNAGKSTVLDACRALSGCLRYTRIRVPNHIRLTKTKNVWGYTVPSSLIPINLINAQTNYSNENSQIDFLLTNGNRLTLLLRPDKEPLLVLDEPETTTRTLADFQRNFPIQIAILPTLGPFEEEEDLLTGEYVERWGQSRRAHRLFRNIWYRKTPEAVNRFKELVATTWPGMRIGRVEIDTRSRRLTMFATEGRIDREIAWAGFGFQVWLQFLTHLLAAEDANHLVIDEPDIYLHPDLQHKLFHLLRESGKQVMLATHSVEIINEAEPEDVILIDKSQRKAQRVHDIEGLQSAVSSIGSAQNTQLARLTRSNRIIFFEGQDFKLIRRLAGRLQYSQLAAGIDHAFIPIGGFAQYGRVKEAAWVLKSVLRSSLKVGAIFDRDYRCEEEIAEFEAEMQAAGVTCVVLKRKEIENYFLDANILEKALLERLGESGRRPANTNAIGQKVHSILERVTDAFREEVAAQRAAHRVRYLTGRSRLDASTIVVEAMQQVNLLWPTIENRLRLVPGKSALAAINAALQQEFSASLTPALLVRSIDVARVPTDLATALAILNAL